jgi:hypothetical protein
MALGFASPASNAVVDLVVAFAADGIQDGAVARPVLVRRLRQTSSMAMAALDFDLALAKCAGA